MVMLHKAVHLNLSNRLLQQLLHLLKGNLLLVIAATMTISSVTITNNKFATAFVFVDKDNYGKSAILRSSMIHRTTGSSSSSNSNTYLKGVESEVTFDTKLDGSQMRIGIIKARWNTEHVDNLTNGIKQALNECNVTEENIFETSVPGSYELPLAARFLALSGTVDAIICVGVLIKGETMHFEYISDAVAKGIMNIGIQTSTPIIFGVLTALNVKQVVARSTGTTNHGYDWGKTAVEMALLRTEAMGGKAADTPLKELGFGLTKSNDKSKKELEKAKPGFF